MVSRVSPLASPSLDFWAEAESVLRQGGEEEGEPRGEGGGEASLKKSEGKGIVHVQVRAPQQAERDGIVKVHQKGLDAKYTSPGKSSSSSSFSPVDVEEGAPEEKPTVEMAAKGGGEGEGGGMTFVLPPELDPHRKEMRETAKEEVVEGASTTSVRGLEDEDDLEEAVRDLKEDV